MKTPLVGLCLFLAAAASASEKKIKPKDAPEAVQRVVAEQSQGAKVKRLVRDTEGRKVTYELELDVHGKSKDVTIMPDGTLGEIEEEVVLADLPGPAKDAVEKAASGAKILKIEAVSHGGVVEVYEASFKKNGKAAEVRVDPLGNPAPR